MTNDDFAGIFDDLTPDMFFAETSAVHEDEGKWTGAEAFNQVVDESLRGLRLAFASTHGQVNPTAILANATVRRFYVPDQDENLGQFLERLKREARAMGAHWFYFAKRNVYASWQEPEDATSKTDMASPEAMQKASEHGSELQVGLCWYAERREGDDVHHRHGVMSIEDNKITGTIEGDGDQTMGVFSAVLDVVRR